MGKTHYLHRSKAITCYLAARELIHKDLTYPAYIMLKESLRAAIAYACELEYEKEYKDKTKLDYLLNAVPNIYVPEEQLQVFKEMLELEKSGFESVMTVDIGVLKRVKMELKRLISLLFGEQVV